MNLQTYNSYGEIISKSRRSSGKKYLVKYHASYEDRKASLEEWVEEFYVIAENKVEAEKIGQAIGEKIGNDYEEYTHKHGRFRSTRYVYLGGELKEIIEVESSAKETAAIVEEINQELISTLNQNPHLMHSLDAYVFENVVAEILADMGLNVSLTPKSKDGGRDILATVKTPLGELLFIVECKRYSPANKVGISIVERFLWVLDRKDNANCGVIVTTSYFSSCAIEYAEEYKWKLKLADFGVMKNWLSNYGQWCQNFDTGLWLPSTKIIPHFNPAVHFLCGMMCNSL